MKTVYISLTIYCAIMGGSAALAAHASCPPLVGIFSLFCGAGLALMLFFAIAERSEE